MSNQDWSAWDRWVEAHIRNALVKHGDMVAEALGAEVGLIQKAMEQTFQDKLDKLAEEVGSLRAELTLLRAHETRQLRRVAK